MLPGRTKPKSYDDEEDDADEDDLVKTAIDPTFVLAEPSFIISHLRH